MIADYGDGDQKMLDIMAFKVFKDRLDSKVYFWWL